MLLVGKPVEPTLSSDFKSNVY